MKIEDKEVLKWIVLEAILRKSHLLCGLEIHSIEFHKKPPEIILNLDPGSRQLIYLIMEDFSVEKIEKMEAELGKDEDLPYFWVDIDALGDCTPDDVLELDEKGIAIAMFVQREDGSITLVIPREYDIAEYDPNDLDVEEGEVSDDFFWEYIH